MAKLRGATGNYRCPVSWSTGHGITQIITLFKISFLTAVKTCISLRLSVPEGQYRLNPECEILRFPRKGSCMHTTAASWPSPAPSAEIVHSYPLPQFCCMTNINNFCCDSDFHQQKTMGLLLQRIGSSLQFLAPYLYLLMGLLLSVPFQVPGFLLFSYFPPCLCPQMEFFLFFLFFCSSLSFSFWLISFLRFLASKSALCLDMHRVEFAAWFPPQFAHFAVTVGSSLIRSLFVMYPLPASHICVVRLSVFKDVQLPQHRNLGSQSSYNS